ncbi:hypothetical protein D3C76_1768730 [compost metagenome]
MPENLRYISHSQNGNTVRFLQIGSHLRQQFVGCNANGTWKSQFFPYSLLDALRNFHGCAELFRACDIQITFIY